MRGCRPQNLILRRILFSALQITRKRQFFFACGANETAGRRVMRDMKNSWTGGEAAYAVETVEENLALAVHRCEPGAFERLIERYEDSLVGYAHGILQNAHDA